ncbi:hypothetical protein [Streptacidiphilus monticola]|uniref:Uncharacterized protein n=1 Tax=Streptacidiphilus monticola TaxID=2161674 RepID=A0ABW1G4Q7_9ACTN
MSDKGGTLQQVLTHPTGTLLSVAGRVPGAGVVRGAANNVLELVGAVSPRSRRIAERAGAGVREAAGVLDWPFATVGAAVAGLLPGRREPEAEATPTPLDVAKVAEAHRQEHMPQPEPQAPEETPFEELDTPSDRLP